MIRADHRERDFYSSAMRFIGDTILLIVTPVRCADSNIDLLAPFYLLVSNKFQSLSLTLSHSARSIKSWNNGITAEREIDHEGILSSAQLVTFNICLRTYLSMYPLMRARTHRSEITCTFFAKTPGRFISPSRKRIVCVRARERK